MKLSEIKVSYHNLSKDDVTTTNSKDVWKVALLNWDEGLLEYQEEVKALLLNRANKVLGIYDLSRGGTASCIVDLKVILAVALKCNAHSVILIHNHPSGNIKPSEVDKNITKRLKEACSVVDLKLLDHLIISKDAYFSFADDGIL